MLAHVHTHAQICVLMMCFSCEEIFTLSCEFLAINSVFSSNVPDKEHVCVSETSVCLFNYGKKYVTGIYCLFQSGTRLRILGIV